ncbi:DNA-binding transcriptional MerR regulator [Paenibacillus sp. DS2015]|uniref:MerR family transcriptional regulator n=1 Tax=Paenibacillus sp. DS2015 TaxID=3373917 RepID=UPI003D1B006E
MYGIKKASELLGIPTVTLRAWENRYQIISPIRSNGGHRLYSETDIETLKWLKHQIDVNNMKISEAVWLLKQRTLEGPVKREQVLHSNTIYDDLINRLFHDLADLNTIRAHETIDLAFSMYHYDDVFHNILIPVLFQMGLEWENGNITVAQEHFSTQLVMQRFTQFFRILPTYPHLPKVLALCPEGEQHHIGLMLFSLFLRKKGMDVIYLGPNVPLSELTILIEMKNIRVVAISITHPCHIGVLEDSIEVCHGEFPDLKFVLGGVGFQDCVTPISSYVLSDDQISWEQWYNSEIESKL